MASLDAGLFVNFALSLLLKKIVVPSDYENQVKAVKEMQMDDLSGLVDSLTDFAVESASVDFSIETDNEQFTKILKKWSSRVNLDYSQIPSGIQELSKEYFKVRWKYSSFPVLKIAEWEEMDGITVPTKMFFVDGQSIVARDIDEEDENLKVTNYDYYLGSKKEDKYKLEKNCIFARPYGRWFDKYPVPYLIKRGVYHNWKIIQSLKNMQSKILDQIIPYMLLIRKGSEGLAVNDIKTYSNPELEKVVEDMQSLMDEIKSTKVGEKSIKSPIRATNYDEEISHLIPDLKSIMQPELFAQAERNILSGLGFIDVIQGISDTRRESVLNPKGFVTEIKSGVEGFRGILKELVFLIQEKNRKHTKYMNSEFYVNASPVKAFMTDGFKQQIRQMYDRGRISSQTAVELIAEVDFTTEVHRREKEEKEGISKKMYPVITRNQEDKGIDLPKKEPKKEDKNGKPLPDDKVDPTEREEYDIGAKYNCSCPKCKFKRIAPEGKHCNEIKCPKCGSSMRRVNRPGTGRPDKSPNAKKTKAELEGSPYPTIQSLPPAVKKLSKKKQRTFMKAWNRAYYYKLAKTKNKKVAETYAFKVAYSAIKPKKRVKRK